MSAFNSSPYASIIASATGACSRDLGLIETIMRTEVYHSTLDWQSASALAEGARKAFRILQSNRLFYELSRQQNELLCKEIQIRQRIEKAQVSLSRAEGRSDAAQIDASQQKLARASKALSVLNEQTRILSTMLDRLSGYSRTAGTTHPALSS